MSTKTRLEPNIISKAPRQKKDGKATARGQKVPAPIGRPGKRREERKKANDPNCQESHKRGCGAPDALHDKLVRGVPRGGALTLQKVFFPAEGPRPQN